MKLFKFMFIYFGFIQVLCHPCWSCQNKTQFFYYFFDLYILSGMVLSNGFVCGALSAKFIEIFDIVSQFFSFYLSKWKTSWRLFKMWKLFRFWNVVRLGNTIRHQGIPIQSLIPTSVTNFNKCVAFKCTDRYTLWYTIPNF